METSAPVVVIGGGIVGCTTAYFLAKRGVPAVLVEKGEIAGEQSSRNWGFVRQQGRDAREVPLMVECNRMWQGFERELEADLEWIQGGNIALAKDEAKLSLMEGWLEVARQYQLQTRILSRREVEDLVPGINTACVGAIYTPGDGQAEPAKASAAFRHAAERRGARFHTNCAALAIEVEGGRVSGVVTEEGEIRTKAVVCAAGAWSSRIVRTLGLSLPQAWLRGTVARTTPGPAVTAAGVWTEVAFRQRRDGSLNIAAGTESNHDIMIDSFRHLFTFLPTALANRTYLRPKLGKPFFDHLSSIVPGRAARAREFKRFRTLDPPPNRALVERALGTLHRTLPALKDVRVERSWAGYIDFTPDFIPVIDTLDRPAGLVLATGMSGHGFGMGPIVGRLVSELIVDGKASLDVSGFRFGRFADGTLGPPKNVL